MKKYILICTVLFVTGFVFTACVENETFIPTDTPSVFHFTEASVSVEEVILDKDGEPEGTENTLTLTVMWSKHLPASGNVTLAVYPRTDVPAIENTDYTISTKSLSFTDEQYTQTISITTKYDPTFTGKKTFTVKITSADADGAKIGTFGASDSCMVTINDVNHPLVALIGAAKMNFTSPFNGARSVNVDIVPDETDMEVLWLKTNLVATFNNPLKMIVKETEDKDGFEVTIPLPQEAGKSADGVRVVLFIATQGGSGTTDDVNIVGTTSKSNIDIFFEEYAFGLYVFDNDEGMGFFEFIFSGTLHITK